MANSDQADFDGYRKWLGIPEEHRPPSFYKLLAISLDEEDPDVIRAAVEQRRSFIESKRGEGHEQAVNEILYQIGEAEVTLLNAEMRRDYDRRLGLFEKRKRERQVDPTVRPTRLGSRGGRTVGEGSGIVGTFAGITAVLVVGFCAAAFFSFNLPWIDPPKPDGVEGDVQAAPVPRGGSVLPAEPAVVPAAAELVGRFEGHTGYVTTVAFSPDGRRIASGSGFRSNDATLRLWDAASGELLQTCPCSGGVMHVCFSPDGRFVLASQWDDRKASLWDAETGQPAWETPAHAAPLNGGAFSPDGTLAYTGDQKGLKEWNVDTGALVRMIPWPEGVPGRVNHIFITPDGRHAVTGPTPDGFALHWDLRAETAQRLWQGQTPNDDLAMPPDGTRLVSTSRGTVTLHDWRPGEVQRLDVPTSPTDHVVTFSPDGRQVIVCERYKGSDCLVYDLKSRRTVARFPHGQPRVLAIAVSPDGRSVVLAGGPEEGDLADYALRLWRLPESVWPAGNGSNAPPTDDGGDSTPEATPKLSEDRTVENEKPPESAGRGRADDPTPQRELNPFGHRAGELTNQPPRFQVWYDEDAGWHLRSAAPDRRLFKFEGTVRVVGGQFRGFRPVGLDAGGKRPDRWAVDGKREALTFQMHTAGSFDGFDFTVAPASATLEFGLKIGGREQPDRIFVGVEDHPTAATFTLPASPQKRPASAK